MAGGSTSEEMDAFDDVTPPKPVSIYDLDEDLPTRTQSSDEIAEFQKLAREKRAAVAFRSFGPPKRDVVSTPPDESSVSGRPIPRESGPVRIHAATNAPMASLPALISPPSAEEADLDAMLNDVAAGLERLPPAPRLPRFEEMRGTLETIHGVEPAAVPRRRGRRSVRALGAMLVLAAVMLAAAIFYLFFQS